MREASVRDLSPAAVRQQLTRQTGSARGPTFAAHRTRQMTGWIWMLEYGRTDFDQ